MNKTAVFFALFALVFAGCKDRSDKILVVRTADIPAPAADIVVRQEKLDDGKLMLLQAVDWRTWKLTFPEVKPTDAFLVQLILKPKNGDESRIVGQLYYMPLKEGIALESAPYVLISLFPQPLTESITSAKTLKIKASFVPAQWESKENQGCAWGGSTCDRVVPNYHLFKGGGQSIRPQDQISTTRPGRYLLDYGPNADLILNISRVK